MTNDEIGAEAALAHIFDALAGELNGVAEQLRRKPYATVEKRVIGVSKRLRKAADAGRLLKADMTEPAHRLIHELSAGI